MCFKFFKMCSELKNLQQEEESFAIFSKPFLKLGEENKRKKEPQT